MINTEALYDWLLSEGYQPELVEDDTEITIQCTLCQDDRPRLYINTESGAWHCFHCGEEGSIHRFFLAVAELSGAEAMEVVSEMQGESNQDWYHEEPKAKKPVIIPTLRLPDAFKPINTNAPRVYLKYLHNRGISTELASARGIGYANTGRYARRVIVPVVNDGVLYTYIGRTILTECPNCGEAINDCTCRPRKFPKVLTPSSKEGSRPRQALYNLDAVRASRSSRMVVVEGWGDALRLPNESVAIIGSSVSATQLTLLAGVARGREVIIALDADQAGYTGALKLAEALTAEMIKVRVALLPPGSDPGSLGPRALERFLAAARKFIL